MSMNRVEVLYGPRVLYTSTFVDGGLLVGIGGKAEVLALR